MTIFTLSMLAILACIVALELYLRWADRQPPSDLELRIEKARRMAHFQGLDKSRFLDVD